MAKLSESEYQKAQNTSMKSNKSEQLDDQYKSICKTSIVCAVFACLSVMTLSMVLLLAELGGLLAAIIAVFGFGFGLISLFTLKRYPDELIGFRATYFGLAMTGLVMAIGIGNYAYVVATEVPEGYERISFSMLKPDKRLNETFPSEMEQYDGKKVFIKGFVRPSDRKLGLEKFLLVGDFGSCCFGGTPKLTEMVAIDLENGLTTNHNYKPRRIGGVFRLYKSGKAVNEDGVPNVIYTIEADYIK